jgi:hypothetical protein
MRLISSLHHARVCGDSHNDAAVGALEQLQQAVEKAKA